MKSEIIFKVFINYRARFYNAGPLCYISLNPSKNEAYKNKKEPFKFDDMQMCGPVFFNLA